ncbi:monovalent cation/H+ antiporter complex subunit F [Tissierella sp. Yu-01]|uniref:monovalent cation/H+ antiporter complex subunit F n=1 Tax=Tissierella sp. Yu-01 TaxID=3035694 RepID=UPI00240D68CC|nr:monovalent cation/H+ antiporter complex subunit F [Tissierella sp. Yu-01]WFA08469.1 monovalent cation/H+ antiporter complex subunit F [Tissierella sp. Yu-01]
MDILWAQELVLIVGIVFLAITAIFCLIRSILGPRFTDRILGINVINVKIIILICILAAYLKKTYLVDIALVYAAISFLSVVVLSRLYLKEYLDNNLKKSKKDGDNSGVN